MSRRIYFMENICGGFYFGKKKTGIADVRDPDLLCVHSGGKRLGAGYEQSGTGRGKKVDRCD